MLLDTACDLWFTVRARQLSDSSSTSSACNLNGTSPPLVATFLEQDTAIDLLSADRHAEHLAGSDRSSWVFALHQSRQSVSICPFSFSLPVFACKVKPPQNCVADERRDQTVHHIRIAFQITGACANETSRLVRSVNFRRFVSAAIQVEPPVNRHHRFAVALHIVHFAEHRTPAHFR